MVDKIKGVDATTSAKEIKKLEEEAAKKAVKEEKAQEVKKTDKSDKFTTTSVNFSNMQILDYTKVYINNLISRYKDNEEIVDSLRAYLMHFNVDTFIKTYPDATTKEDLSVALHNETMKFL